MEIFIGISVLLLLVVFVSFFTNIGGDYTKRTDQQLVRLRPLHERNVRAAKAAGPEAYKKALEKASTLTEEMKKRGLLQPDFTFDSDLLDRMSKDSFSRSFEEIKSLARKKDPTALYQIGIIFDAMTEPYTAIQYMSESADLGNVDAQYALGCAYITEGKGVERDAAAALKWFKIATDNGHGDAERAFEVTRKFLSQAQADFALSEAKQWTLNRAHDRAG